MLFYGPVRHLHTKQEPRQVVLKLDGPQQVTGTGDIFGMPQFERLLFVKEDACSDPPPLSWKSIGSTPHRALAGLHPAFSVPACFIAAVFPFGACRCTWWILCGPFQYRL